MPHPTPRAMPTAPGPATCSTGWPRRPIPLADRKPGGLGDLTPGTVIVLPEEPPEGMDRVDLAGVEWRVIVRGGRGDTLGNIADRLDLSLETVQAVVDGLWCRGLVATVHPEVAAPA